jgi:hypothetical protein
LTLNEQKWFIFGKASKGVLPYAANMKDVILKQPKYTTAFPVPPFDKPYEELTPMNNIVINYTYTITQ